MSSTEAPVVEITALAVVQTITAADLFKPEKINPVLEKIKAEALAVTFDMSTDAGRKACGSLAYKIARTKSFIEDQRKDLVSAQKKELKVIDDEGKRIREFLDDLKDQVRKPFTDWELLETARVEKCEARMNTLVGLTHFETPEPTVEDLKIRIEVANAMSTDDMQEFESKAIATKHDSLKLLKNSLAVAIARENERKELERLRQAEADRIQKDRDDKIAADAAAKAKADAEAASAKAIADAKVASDKAIADAEAARVKAENDAAEAKRKAEVDRIAAEKKAEDDRVLAAKKAQDDADAAVKAERDRVEKERLAAEEVQRKRSADLAHREQIDNGAVFVLTDALNIKEALARRIVMLISEGKVPNVSVNY